MNIWLTCDTAQNRECTDTLAEGVGVILPSSEKAPADLPCMLECDRNSGLPSHVSGCILLIPAGSGGDVPWVAECAGQGHALFIAVNGLGMKSIEALRTVLAGNSYGWTIDCRGMDRRDVFHHFAWLKAQPEPCAAFVNGADQAQAAAMMDFDHILLDFHEKAVISEITLLHRLYKPGCPKPLCTAEVDALEEGEASLTAAQQLLAGETISREHITVAKTPEKGIAPCLLDAIVGKTLRYDVAPGASITFGHLLGDW